MQRLIVAILMVGMTWWTGCTKDKKTPSKQGQDGVKPDMAVATNGVLLPCAYQSDTGSTVPLPAMLTVSQ